MYGLDAVAPDRLVLAESLAVDHVPEHGPILDWFDVEPMLGAELRRADDAKRTHCTGSIELLPAHRPGPQQLTVGVRGG